MFYAIINPYQYKTSELKNLEKLVEQTFQTLMFCLVLERTGNVHVCTVCYITFLKGGPWKSNVVLKKFLKSPWNVLPCQEWCSRNYFPSYPKIILNLWIILWPYRISQQAFSPKDLCLACYHFKGCQHMLTTSAVAAYFEVFAGCKLSIIVNHKC